MKKLPPTFGDFSGAGQCLARDCAAGRAAAREITRYLGRIRRLKIRSYGAACQCRDEYQEADRIRRRYAWSVSKPNAHARAIPRAVFGRTFAECAQRSDN